MSKSFPAWLLGATLLAVPAAHAQDKKSADAQPDAIFSITLSGVNTDTLQTSTVISITPASCRVHTDLTLSGSPTIHFGTAMTVYPLKKQERLSVDTDVTVSAGLITFARSVHMEITHDLNNRNLSGTLNGTPLSQARLKSIESDFHAPAELTSPVAARTRATECARMIATAQGQLPRNGR